MGETPAGTGRADDRAELLESWKEIAAYLKRDVRTVQRWEKKEGLPVHRHQHERQGSVYGYKSELDAWWKSTDPKVTAEVSAAGDVDGNLGDDTEEFVLMGDPEGRPLTRQPWFRFTAAVALLAFATVAAWIAYRRVVGDRRTGPVRLLVLPLDNLSGDSQQAYFSSGMTEEVITDLAKADPSSLAVMAGKTSQHYQGVPIDQIRRELNVDYVVEGSVLRANDRVRITAQLIRAEDQTHIWAHSYEGDLRDVIGLQGQVADAIAQEISVRTVHSHPPARVDPAAYDAFLRGRYFWNKRGVDSLKKAMEYFTLAVQKDPEYAPAHAGLADGFAILGSAQTGALAPDAAFPRAKAEALRAVALDDSLAEPHATLGYIALVYDRDRDTAEREFTRAIALNPHYATAHQWYGLLLISAGKFPQAIQSVQRAESEDPLSLAANISLAEAYYFARDYDKAIAQAQKAVELEPTSALGHFNLGRAYEMKGRYADALSEFQLARANSPNAATLVPLGHALALSGSKTGAMASIADLQQIARGRQYVPAIYFALIYTGLQDRDKAFRALDQAYAENCDYLVFLEQDPMADPLRSDARFASLVRKIAAKRQ